MIDRFNGCIFCALILILQFVCLPLATTSAAEMQADSADVEAESSGAFGLSGFSGQKSRGTRQDGGGLLLPEK